MDSKIFKSDGEEMAVARKIWSSEFTIQSDLDYTQFCGGLQINLPLEKSTEDIKIEIQGFNNLNFIWLGKIYRQYEGQLWVKCFIGDDRMKFHCLFCDKVLFRFHSLTCHLNLHLEIYPFKCYACEKKYTSYTSLYKHRITKHDYNQYLTVDAGH